jgi:hypothetical protein
MCCKVLAVAELDKPMGLLCAHCRPGQGCGVYLDRPVACRTFECVWLLDPEMPHRFRPDQSKVMLEQDHGGRRLIARCDPANPMAWRRNPIYGALKAYAAKAWESGGIVIAVAGRHVWLIAPREDVDVGEIDPAAAISVVERADGRVELTIMPGPGTP